MKLFHDPDLARRVGLLLAGVSVAATLGGLALFVAAGGRLTASWMPQNLVGSLTLAAAFAAMVRHQPHNGAVWTLGWSMVFMAFGQALLIGATAFGVSSVLGAEVIREGLPYTLGELPTWLAWMHTADAVTWIPAIVPLVTVALLLFPDGHLPSRRWRPVAALALVAMAVTTVAFGLAARPGSEVVISELESAFDPGPTTAVLLAVGGVSTAVAIVASIASLVVRYRRSSGIQRRQIRWIAAGGTVFASSMLIWVWAPVNIALVERAFWVASLVTFPVLLGSYAVAILRYQLYGIDVVISRSLVLAVLAAFIAAVYVAVVVGVGQLFGTDDRSRLGLQVVATGIIAIAFQPLRMRVRRMADRLVLGHRATPYEVLSGFSRQAANAGDEATLERIAELLAAGTGADPAIVWLRVGDRLRPAAVSGGTTPPAPVAVGRDGGLPELGATLTRPVDHEGELLGAVTVTKARSEQSTEQDEELVSRLAGGLALVLRNARLTEELRDRLVDLERSRQRIVQAQDDARRRIEQDLRGGAQRHLARLKALLGAARKHATDSRAERTAQLLAQLEDEAEDAVTTLQDLAHGIYPAVLEEHGLGPALSEQARRTPVPVSVHSAGLGRLPREVEGAVYFCVLETLQNASKYADAGSVHVRLERRDDGLRFEVTDDGVGFDVTGSHDGSGLRGIGDRLDALGGELWVRSTPGSGTRVTGFVPLGSGDARSEAPRPATVGGAR